MQFEVAVDQLAHDFSKKAPAFARQLRLQARSLSATACFSATIHQALMLARETPELALPAGPGGPALPAEDVVNKYVLPALQQVGISKHSTGVGMMTLDEALAWERFGEFMTDSIRRALGDVPPAPVRRAQAIAQPTESRETPRVASHLDRAAPISPAQSRGQSAAAAPAAARQPADPARTSYGESRARTPAQAAERPPVPYGSASPYSKRPVPPGKPPAEPDAPRGAKLPAPDTVIGAPLNTMARRRRTT